MDNTTYMKGVLTTESNDFAAIADRISNPKAIRLLHAAMGLATEAGELVDQLKKAFFYGKPVDEINLIEELGDLRWYENIMMDELKVTAEEVQAINNKKLTDKKAGRYKKGQFTSVEAYIRDIESERKILEGNTNE